MKERHREGRQPASLYLDKPRQCNYSSQGFNLVPRLPTGATDGEFLGLWISRIEKQWWVLFQPASIKYDRQVQVFPESDPKAI
jgi:hypothetical protein